MEIHPLPKTRYGRTIGESRSNLVDRKDVRLEEMESSSLINLFCESLKRMAHILKPDLCGSANHYDCVMHIHVTGEDIEQLWARFLEKTLELAHLHKTIFCSVNVIEFSKRKLVAQLFGIRLDCFQTDIKSIAPNNCSVEKDGKGGYFGSILFDLQES